MYLSDDIITTLDYVSENYLKKPYTDADKRGVFINARGLQLEYPHSAPLELEEHAVYRPNHGPAHNTRVVAKVRDVAAMYTDPSINRNSAAQQIFAELNTPTVLAKLEIVCAFYVAGRESEAGFSADPQSPYQQYRRAAAQAFLDYAQQLSAKTNSPSFSETELQLYANILQDPYYNPSTDGSALNQNNANTQNTTAQQSRTAAIKAILSSCHALDLGRCFGSDKMTKKLAEVATPLDTASDLSTIAIWKLFAKSEIQQLLIGSKTRSSFNTETQTFAPSHQRVRTFLFMLANNNSKLCARLVNLAEHIGSLSQARSLANILNRYAKHQQLDLFKHFLSRIESTAQSSKSEDNLQTLIDQENQAHPTHEGRIFKSVRNDAACFEDYFEKELIFPEIPHQNLRNYPRKKYTVRHNGKDQYEIVPTNKANPTRKPRLSPAEKATFTQHQSSSYSNDDAGYNPPVFGHQANRAELLVGISLALKDCQIWRVLMYDGGTVSRPYDFDSKDQAQEFLQKMLDAGIYHRSVSSLQEYGLRNNENKHNEVMARYQWNFTDQSSHITVFTNNLESRLLAQVRALSLATRLQGKYPDKQITVPISIYPEYILYTDQDQQRDQLEAVRTYGEYLLVQQWLKGDFNVSEDTTAIAFFKAIDLLKKTNLSVYQQAKATLDAAIPELLQLKSNLYQAFGYLPISQFETFMEIIYPEETALKIFTHLIQKHTKSAQDFEQLLAAIDIEHIVSHRKIELVIQVLEKKLSIFANSAYNTVLFLTYLNEHQLDEQAIVVREKIIAYINSNKKLLQAFEKMGYRGNTRYLISLVLDIKPDWLDAESLRIIFSESSFINDEHFNKDIPMIIKSVIKSSEDISQAFACDSYSFCAKPLEIIVDLIPELLTIEHIIRIFNSVNITQKTSLPDKIKATIDSKYFSASDINLIVEKVKNHANFQLLLATFGKKLLSSLQTAKALLTFIHYGGVQAIEENRQVILFALQKCVRTPKDFQDILRMLPLAINESDKTCVSFILTTFDKNITTLIDSEETLISFINKASIKKCREHEATLLSKIKTHCASFKSSLALFDNINVRNSNKKYLLAINPLRPELSNIITNTEDLINFMKKIPHRKLILIEKELGLAIRNIINTPNAWQKIATTLNFFWLGPEKVDYLFNALTPHLSKLIIHKKDVIQLIKGVTDDCFTKSAAIFQQLLLSNVSSSSELKDIIIELKQPANSKKSATLAAFKAKLQSIEQNRSRPSLQGLFKQASKTEQNTTELKQAISNSVVKGS